MDTIMEDFLDLDPWGGNEGGNGSETGDPGLHSPSMGGPRHRRYGSSKYLFHSFKKDIINSFIFINFIFFFVKYNTKWASLEKNQSKMPKSWFFTISQKYRNRAKDFGTPLVEEMRTRKPSTAPRSAPAHPAWRPPLTAVLHKARTLTGRVNVQK